MIPAVRVLRWPDDAADRDEAARLGDLCLLLVAADVAPPTVRPTEDWIRTPADAEDVLRQVRSLRRRCYPNAELEPVELTDDVVLRRGASSVVLSEAEAEVLRLLLEKPEQVVHRSYLEEAIWPDGPPSARTLDTRVKRLRNSIAVLGLGLLTVRGQGVILSLTTELDPPAGW